MTISQITNDEFSVLEIVQKLKGTMEERRDQLSQKGIFDQYNKIFNQYASIHQTDIEALKRCLFLYWYSSCEPSCYTGLHKFDDESVRKVIMTLSDRLSQGNLDDELDWMLAYYSRSTFTFDHFPKLKSILDKRNPVEMPLTIHKEAMKKRGQMGKYWSSLNRFK